MKYAMAFGVLRTFQKFAIHTLFRNVCNNCLASNYIYANFSLGYLWKSHRLRSWISQLSF